MNIRRASAADAEQLLDLDKALAKAGDGMVATPEQVGPIEVVRRRLEESTSGASLEVVAQINAQLVGNALLKQLRPTRCRHVGLLSVGVHPAHQRRGIGMALMQALIEHAREHEIVRLELYVRSDNIGAQELYRRLGFVHEATRARFVRLDDGSFIDDFVYCRFLDLPVAATRERDVTSIS